MEGTTSYFLVLQYKMKAVIAFTIGIVAFLVGFKIVFYLDNCDEMIEIRNTEMVSIVDNSQISREVLKEIF